MVETEALAQVERWGVYEVALDGPQGGNPFLEVMLDATFALGARTVQVGGFYDGDGVYRIRFMPDETGVWTYATTSGHAALDGKTGAFQCVAPSAGNHGPVRVCDTVHFGYADGTPYYPFGTTCYAWIHQEEALQLQTLETLAQSPFNKVRMCVFPKDYVYNRNEPPRYPFVRAADRSSDYDRFDPAFFRHLERRIADLGALGIEADVILFHPYDRWGYSEMTPRQDFHYVRYLVTRLAAYRNVWWSMANEYDFLLDSKPMEQWDLYFRIVGQRDPYRHLCSIHNGSPDMCYDHTRPWISHVCLQHWDVRRARAWRAQYGKPVIDDECEYEGNIPLPWGNLSPRELVHRFWVMVTSGCYAGHGETYVDPQDVLWWSKGGVLRGESWKRIGFLRQIVEAGPGPLAPVEGAWVWSRVCGAQRGAYRLLYFGEHQPSAWSFGLPEDVTYEVDVIDTWEMTVDTLPGTFRNAAQIPLPGKPYLAVRIRPTTPAPGEGANES
ncbi:MAG: DUF5605 domain-containing protein [Anaerolineae bacterium]|nr:DUF5605 domain-containing protein [Anaerolineae bacterium]